MRYPVRYWYYTSISSHGCATSSALARIYIIDTGSSCIHGCRSVGDVWGTGWGTCGGRGGERVPTLFLQACVDYTAGQTNVG